MYYLINLGFYWLELIVILDHIEAGSCTVTDEDTELQGFSKMYLSSQKKVQQADKSIFSIKENVNNVINYTKEIAASS